MGVRARSSLRHKTPTTTKRIIFFFVLSHLLLTLVRLFRFYVRLCHCLCRLLCRYYCCCLGLFLLSFLLCSSLNMGERFVQLHTRYIRIRIICVFCLFVALIITIIVAVLLLLLLFSAFAALTILSILDAFHFTRTLTHSENRSITFPDTLCERKVCVCHQFDKLQNWSKDFLKIYGSWWKDVM